MYITRLELLLIIIVAISLDRIAFQWGGIFLKAFLGFDSEEKYTYSESKRRILKEYRCLDDLAQEIAEEDK